MKYTNKHIKEEYKFNQMWRTIGMILLLIGIFLVAFGLIQTKRKMDCVRPFEQVLQEEANPANQTAYIDIIQVPEKLAENKYEGYYLVTTAEESYIVGMQPEQFADLKQRVEENGTARVEGMTKVVTDENVKKIISDHHHRLRGRLHRRQGRRGLRRIQGRLPVPGPDHGQQLWP